MDESLATNARMAVDDDLFKILDLFIEEDRDQKSDLPQWTAMELASASIIMIWGLNAILRPPT
jgi:hypothetical protein